MFRQAGSPSISNFEFILIMNQFIIFIITLNNSIKQISGWVANRVSRTFMRVQGCVFQVCELENIDQS